MKNHSLVEFLNSSVQPNTIEHFLQLMARTTTFEQKLGVLQEQLRQAEQLKKQSIHQMGQDKQQYQQEIRKLTQQHCEQLNKETTRVENKYRQEIEQLQQKINQQIEIEKIFEIELEKGVWIDAKTGLMWARISIGQEWKDGQYWGESKALSWEQAEKSCQDFRLAGYNNWRLPSISELKTLISKDKAGYACPQGVLFQPVANEWGGYWSGSLGEHSDHYAWAVNFNYSDLIGSIKSNERYVRAVRNIFKKD